MTHLALALVLAATPVRLDEVRAVSRRNVQALLAELDRARALQGAGLARAPLLPQLNVALNAGRAYNAPARFFATVPNPDPLGTGYVQTVVGTPTNRQDAFGLQITLSQLLVDGTRWAELARAGAQAEAAEGQAREQQLASELEGVRRFYGLFVTQRSRVILEGVVQRSAEQLDRARALYDAGRMGKGEALAAQVNLGTDRIVAARQELAIAAAQGDLALWILLPGTEDLEAVDPGFLEATPKAPPGLQEAVALARARRPLLVSLAARVHAAEAGVSGAHAGFYPTLSARGLFARTGPNIDFTFGDWRRQYTAAGFINLSWDVFDGLATVAEVKTADADLRAARLTLEQAVREVERDVSSLLLGLQSWITQSGLAHENREAAVAGLKVADERFRAGAASTLDVRDAQLKLAQAELTFLTTRAEAEVARAALERAMGLSAP